MMKSLQQQLPQFKKPTSVVQVISKDFAVFSSNGKFSVNGCDLIAEIDFIQIA